MPSGTFLYFMVGMAQSASAPDCGSGGRGFESLYPPLSNQAWLDYSKFRISEALMAIYKLFWDEFSSWYLEIVKPAYGQPIDKSTYDATLSYFDKLLCLLHPFMPFITEELWQHLYERKAGESIMYAEWPKTAVEDNSFVNKFETVKEIVAGIRTIRKQKQLPQKEELALQIKGDFDQTFVDVIQKMGNLSAIESVEEKSPTAASFMVGATEFSVPLENKINIEEELAKLNKDLEYYTKFLAGVEKKLSNEKFVANAPEAVVAVERKKQSDATEKIEAIKAAIAALK